MIAVLVVTLMAYETIRKGYMLIVSPAETSNLILNVVILVLAILIDGAILIKAMREIMREARVEVKGFAVFFMSFRYVNRAAPPTRLVIYEDLVATSGAFFALIAVIMSSLTTFHALDGIATIMIGLLMLMVAFKVGYDNMAGLIGVAAPVEIEEKIANMIFSDTHVVDINKMQVIQEGRTYHVDAIIELKKGLTLADADDIKFRVRDMLLLDPDISYVSLGIIEDNDVPNWPKEEPWDK